MTQQVFRGGAALPTIEYSEVSQDSAEFVVRDPRDGMFRVLKLINTPGASFNWANIPKNNSANKILALTAGNAIVWRDPFAELAALTVQFGTQNHGFVAVNRSTGDTVQVLLYSQSNTWTGFNTFNATATFNGPLVAPGGAYFDAPVTVSGLSSHPTANRFIVFDIDGYSLAYQDIRAKRGIAFNNGVFEAVVNTGLRHHPYADWIEVDLNYPFFWLALHTFQAGARIAANRSLYFGEDAELSRMAAGVIGSTTTGIQAESLGIGVTPSDDAANVHIRSNSTPQFIVEQLNTRTRMSMSVDGNGNLIWDVAGDIVLNPAGRVIRPRHPYHTSIGAPNAKILALYAAEAWFDTIVAQDVVSTIGGTIITAPSNVLVYGVPA